MTLQQKILSHFATYDNFNSDDVVETFGISKTHANPLFQNLRKKERLKWKVGVSGVLLNRNCI